MSHVIHWFRRDLRLTDNRALYHALESGKQVQCVFIFDKSILDTLEKTDARVDFIHAQLHRIQTELEKFNSSIWVMHDTVENAWDQITSQLKIDAVYTNEDYEEYAIQRDKMVAKMLSQQGIAFHSYKDQTVFAPGEISKDNGSPYTIYTPYKNKWLAKVQAEDLKPIAITKTDYAVSSYKIPSLEEIGFTPTNIDLPEYNLEVVPNYDKTRDTPSKSTSKIGVHLRFGTIGIRELIQKTSSNDTYISELIWREFFMQILFHFPDVVHHNFKRQYDGIDWINDADQFQRWCDGQTGYPMVDAGMRELNATGFMHNRVRMVTASFLCKHLLIDWRWGEAYFAQKLLDYDLSANNGNWQWAAGTGCDAAPYFRVFNPESQQQKFDPNWTYIRKWVPEFGTPAYPRPMVDHKMARNRAIETYKQGLDRR